MTQYDKIIRDLELARLLDRIVFWIVVGLWIAGVYAVTRALVIGRLF